MEKHKPTIVVTGFGPFGMHVKNASWEAVKLLPHMHLEEDLDVNVEVKEIPVAYDEVDKIIPELWEKHQPLLMVHVGVSNTAKCLTLESCANRRGYCMPDVKECKLLNSINPIGGEEHLKTRIDLNRIQSEAKQLSVDLDVSDDAGRYLCEYAYYSSLNISSCNSIFVHVSMIDADYSASKIAEELKLIIELALRQLREF